MVRTRIVSVRISVPRNGSVASAVPAPRKAMSEIPQALHPAVMSEIIPAVRPIFTVLFV